MEITTPAQVISELNRLMASSSAGINALFEQEVKVAQLDQQYERDLSLGLLNAGSDWPKDAAQRLTSPEKVALSKLKASEAKLALDIGKAELNRIKSKLKAIDSAIMATSVIAKQVELQWRNA